MEKHNINNRQKVFEEAYTAVRSTEQRLLTIEEIRRLPYPTSDFLHFAEWRKRCRSAERLKRYIRQNNSKRILDVGCGNGWFLHFMADLDIPISGIDVNLFELEQAQEVISDYKHISLIYGNLFEIDWNTEFSLIILNACFQYFDNIDLLFSKMHELLDTSGELHILDTPIYKTRSEANTALQRSKAYFSKQGAENMTDFYFAHSYEELNKYEYDLLYNPKQLHRRLRNKFFPDSPFPWLRIKKESLS